MSIVSTKYLKISLIVLSILTLNQFVMADPDSDSDDSDGMSIASSRYVPATQDTDIHDEANSDDDAIPSSGGSKVWNKPGIPHAGWTHGL